MANPNIVVVDEHGMVASACSGIGPAIEFILVYSLTCNGGCPTNGPLEIYCPGPYVAA